MAPADMPPVLANAEQTERAIVNLIRNALKYSEADRPVGVRVKQGENAVTVSVTDEGLGVAP